MPVSEGADRWLSKRLTQEARQGVTMTYPLLKLIHILGAFLIGAGHRGLR